jgi:hypothetical protein
MSAVSGKIKKLGTGYVVASTWLARSGTPAIAKDDLTS